MHAEKVKQDTWSMKDAARKVGVGLPRLYEKLRERHLVTINQQDGRKLPTTRALELGYFTVEDSTYYNSTLGCYRPYKKVECTYNGLTLLQEIADELNDEKASDTRQ